MCNKNKGELDEKNNSSNLAALVEKAQTSVSGIKDDKLKEIAFSKIMDHLLGSSDDPKPRNRVKNKVGSKTKIEVRQKLKGPRSWLRELAADNFFAKPKALKDILGELSSRSHHLKPTDLTLSLQALCHEKILRRNKKELPGKNKKVFHWHNW